MTKQARLAAALAALAFAALLAPSAASAARGMELAFSDEYAIVDGQIGSVDEALQRARALNATRMRVLVQWNRASDANESRPSANPDYNWAPIDNAIDKAAAYGIRTYLVLSGPAPNYGAGTYKGLRIRNPNASRFARFAAAAAEHFKGRVDRYAIWNEPNYPSWLQPQRSSPRIYRKLFTASYRAIKKADPRAQVLIGETVPYGGRVTYKRKNRRLGLATPPLQWLRGVLCVDNRYRSRRCPGLKADGYAHHPYDLTDLKIRPKGSFPGADNAPIQELGRLRSALRRLARLRALTTARNRPLDIYLTETGYLTAGKRALPAKRRAAYLREQFDVAARTPSVRSMLQYNLYVPPRSTTTFLTGVLSSNGTPLPEYRSLLSWSTSAARSGRIKRNTGPIQLPPRP